MAVKLVVLMRRRPGMTRQEFIDYHRDSHANTFMADPTISRLCRGYVLSHPVVSGVDGLDDSPFDGVAEVWFDTVDDLREAFSSETYLANVRPDELTFIDVEHSVDFVTEERDLRPPALG